jgi:AcrR family transcriptional regulator
MARRSEHTQEQLKELVLNAAERIITEQGLEALTVRKIALEIGYTVGSIYMVFTNMQELIRHVSIRSLDDLFQHLRAVPDAGSTEANILAMALAYLEFASTEFNRWRIIFCREVAKEAEPDWYAQKVHRVFAPVEEQFLQLGSGKNDAQVKLAARTLWGGVHGVCLLSLHGGLESQDIQERQQAVKLLVENFINGWK